MRSRIIFLTLWFIDDFDFDRSTLFFFISIDIVILIAEMRSLIDSFVYKIIYTIRPELYAECIESFVEVY